MLHLVCVKKKIAILLIRADLSRISYGPSLVCTGHGTAQ